MSQSPRSKIFAALVISVAAITAQGTSRGLAAGEAAPVADPAPAAPVAAPAPTLADAIFKIGDRVVGLSEVSKSDPSNFYDVQKKMYDLLYKSAKELYLKSYWEKLGKSSGKSAAEAQNDYEAKNIKVSDQEVEITLGLSN